MEQFARRKLLSLDHRTHVRQSRFKGSKRFTAKQQFKREKKLLCSAKERGSFWRIYPTLEQRDQAIQAYLRNGFKYIIGWKDTQGWGLQGARLADWQTEANGAYVDLR